MRAAVLEAAYRLVVREVPDPKIEKDQVLVSVDASGVTPIDLSVFEGENPWAMRTRIARRTNPPNIILGHEIAGTVREVGDPGLSHLVGKRVGIIPFHPCGQCELCRAGRANLCRNMVYLGHSTGWLGHRDYFPGGMAQSCPVWADHCQVLPDGVSSEDAVFLDSLATAVHAVEMAQVRPGTSGLVIGCGPVGLGILQMAKRCGAEKLFASDTYPLALDLAAELTGARCIRADTEDVMRVIRNETGAQGVQFVFDTVGIPETQRQARTLLAPGGINVSLAITEHEMSFSLRDLMFERHITTSVNYFPQEFATAIAALADGSAKVNPYITHRLGLSEFPRIIERLRVRKLHNALKAVVFPNQA